MMMDKLIGTQSIIITLDVDTFLFDKLKHIAQAGFSVVEINSAESSLLKKVLHDFPMLRIGAGNVINSQQLDDCHEAGVHFATSPGFLPTLAQTASIYSLNYLPSIATVSEAMQAAAMGCQHVRVYPANLGLCSILNKSLPLLRLFPAEIEWDEVEHFLNLPAVASVSIINPEISHLKNLSEALQSV
ncbi:MAG: bifunctional 4-hydroxy-2-oxoglutarate aldolase/2-dehydro-3-deoxy-phosphogluconate aldolase [Legionellaceae bacterium]|nr:bifunctional 4-hydroxy-2-oxoglutarate aldolase/2-dehydro-3-deoxy-phosphogluconate aldolase [Legionellaceae bacterium]